MSKKASWSLGSIPFHPVLAATLYPLDLMQRSSMTLSNGVGGIVILEACVLGFWAMASPLLGVRRAAYLATWVAIAPRIFEWLPPEFSLAMTVVAAGQMVILLVIVDAMVREGRLKKSSAQGWATPFANGITATVFVAGLPFLPQFARERATPEPIAVSATAKPDVYVVMLDGYPRADTLQTRFDADAQLVDALDQRGFQTAAHSTSNYMQTLFSLSSALNVDYVTELDAEDRVALAATTNDSRVVETFRREGYQTHFWFGGYSLIRLNTDEVHDPIWPSNQVEMFVMSRSLLGGLLDLFWLGQGGTAATMRHRTIRHPFYAIDPPAADAAPQFHFVHSLAPHPSFVVGSEGEVVIPKFPAGMQDHSHWTEMNAPDRYEDGMLRQIEGLNGFILPWLDRLLSTERGRNAVILFISDHGSGAGLDLANPSTEARDDRLRNLWSMRGPPGVEVPDDMHFVNTFRLVLAGYFGADLPLLERRNFQHGWDDPFAMSEVTDQLR